MPRRRRISSWSVFVGKGLVGLRRCRSVPRYWNYYRVFVSVYDENFRYFVKIIKKSLKLGKATNRDLRRFGDLYHFGAIIVIII